jgi:hypothetical protein
VNDLTRTSLAVLLLTLAALWWNTPGAPPPDPAIFLGRWADAADPARTLAVWELERAFEGGGLWVAGASAREGRVTVEGGLLPGATEQQWNYGSWDPLVLNVIDTHTTPTAARFVRLESTGPDRLRLGVFVDPTLALAHDATPPAGWVDLTRTGPPEPPRPGPPIVVPAP